MRRNQLKQTVGDPTVYLFEGTAAKNPKAALTTAVSTPKAASTTAEKTRKPVFQEPPQPVDPAAEQPVQAVQPKVSTGNAVAQPAVLSPERTWKPQIDIPLSQRSSMWEKNNTKKPERDGETPSLSNDSPAPFLNKPVMTQENAEQNLTNWVNTWLTSSNSYFDGYNARFGNRKGDFSDAYVGDSQEYLDATNRRARELAAGADSIRRSLKQYSGVLNPELVAEITNALDETMVKVEQVLSIAQQDNAYWSSWGNAKVDEFKKEWNEIVAPGSEFVSTGEKAYQKAQRSEEYRQKYAGKSGAELINLINFIDDEDEKDWVTSQALQTLSFDEAAKDLEVMKAEEAEIENSGTLINHYDQKLAMNIEQQKAAIAAKLRRDEIFKKYGVENLDGLKNLISRNEQLIAEAEKVQEYVRLSLVQENEDFEKYVKIGRAEADAYSEENNKTEHMTATEVKVLAYYIAKDRENGTNLAEQYKQTIKHYLKQRRAGEIAYNINHIDIPVIEGIARIGYGVGAGAVDWAMGAMQNFTDEKLEPTVMQMASSYIGSDPELNWFDRTLHNGARAVGNMLPSILISKGLGSAGAPVSLAKAAGSVAHFTSAAGGAYGNALEQGYNKYAARTYATLVGLSEVTLQNILGGISEFGGLPAKLGEKIAAIDNALLKGAAKLAVSEFGEVSEELLQNYLEPLFRTFIFGEEYDEPTLQENLDTILTTLISTGTMEGPGIVSATVSEIKNPTGSGVRYDFGVTQEDIDQYVESAYENKNKQDYKKYAEVSDRLKNDVQKEIVIEGYAHALRDNDIRHIRNSHGEKTKEKYPVTKQDIKNIPWIVENYDKVYTIKRRDGKTGLVYVTVNNQGTVYYLEQVTSKYGNEPLLINKQMIKTGIGDIPGLPGLKEAITKKQSETEFLNDLRKAQQVYAQSVYQSHSNAKVTQTDTNVNDQNSLSAQRQADAGNVSKVGWDGRVAVTEAKGPNITIDGVTYRLLGLDKNGSKVYQDVEVLKERVKRAESKQAEENQNPKQTDDGQIAENKNEYVRARRAVDKEFKEILAKAQNNDKIDLDEDLEKIVAGKHFEEIQLLRQKLSNRAVRRWYNAQDAEIPSLIDRTLGLEGQARQACDLRNRNRTNARELMYDLEKRKQLDRDDPNKTFEELIADKMKRKELDREEAMKDILDTATKTRKSVNKQLGLE